MVKEMRELKKKLCEEISVYNCYNVSYKGRKH